MWSTGANQYAGRTPADHYDLSRIRPEVLLVLNRFNQMGPTFADRAKGMDSDASFPVDNDKDLAAAGYLILTVPKEFGGHGFSLGEYALVRAEIGKYCGAICASPSGAGAGLTALHIGHQHHFAVRADRGKPCFAVDPPVECDRDAALDLGLQAGVGRDQRVKEFLERGGLDLNLCAPIGEGAQSSPKFDLDQGLSPWP